MRSSSGSGSRPWARMADERSPLLPFRLLAHALRRAFGQGDVARPGLLPGRELQLREPRVGLEQLVDLCEGLAHERMQLVREG
jgi:hypothetical protein